MKDQTSHIPSDPETYPIIGAATVVHSQLGTGFPEQLYRAALALEFASRKIAFERDVELNITYKGEALEPRFRADFICQPKILVRAMARPVVGEEDEAQMVNDLKGARAPKGLLLNFGERSLRVRRFVNGRGQDASPQPPQIEASLF